ncbi:peptide-methionine (R)-S-oxide reductase MsrB [Candidatus Babeliales bacterium]|nr:peptide-methionine (R)-S-oxide reductase MsrB [Candidatus Babeliales bacterium]
MLTFFLTTLLLLGDIMPLHAENKNTETATFAGGCFWCMVPPFKKLGNLAIVAGYMDGTGDNPTYEDYAQKGYVEVVQITFDPTEISYQQLLDTYWQQIDPTDSGGQFGDRGPHYHTVIFYHSDEQKKLAQASKKALQESGRFEKPIATEIKEATQFFVAEKYHQNYYEKNPEHYKAYRAASGRDQFLKKVWSQDSKPAETKNKEPENNKYQKPSDEELRKKLSSEQYNVTQMCSTETPFKNEYFNNKRAGIYVDRVSGEPLFSSHDKYDSGTGWPSFVKPLESENIVTKQESGWLSRWFGGRTEVRSKHGDSHLGHVFNDGPAPTGLRYCLNSAALRFIPVEDLEREGYGQYKKLFE